MLLRGSCRHPEDIELMQGNSVGEQGAKHGDRTGDEGHHATRFGGPSQNSAASEQMAASAEKLSGQAITLQDTIAFFKSSPKQTQRVTVSLTGPSEDAGNEVYRSFHGVF